LQDRGVIRLFQVEYAKRDWHVVMLAEDYARAIRVRLASESKVSRQIGERFLQILSHLTTRPYVDADTLLHSMRASPGTDAGAGAVINGPFNVQATKIRTCLLALGVVIAKDPRAYWLSVPGIANFLGCVRAGRRELMAMIQRKLFKEMLLKDLENVRLKQSDLSLKYHIHDMQGLSLLTLVPTASHGVLLQIPKHLVHDEFDEGNFGTA